MSGRVGRTVGAAVLALGVGAAGVVVAPAAGADAVVAQPVGVETSRQEAVQAYQDIVSGDVVTGKYYSSCGVAAQPVSAAEKAKMLQAINGARRLAHVDEVTLGDPGVEGWVAATEAARTLGWAWKQDTYPFPYSHHYSSGAPCYTERGSDASGGSIGMNTSSPSRILQRLLEDTGTESVGHRINALDPLLGKLVFGAAQVDGFYGRKTTAMVLGTVPNDGGVMGSMERDERTVSAPPIVAWPSAGYFPAEFIAKPDQYGEFYWSVTVPRGEGYEGLKDVKVEVKAGNGAFQPAREVVKPGVAFPMMDDKYSTVAFIPSQSVRTPAAGQTVEYTVRLTAGSRQWTYPVRLIRAGNGTSTSTGTSGTGSQSEGDGGGAFMFLALIPLLIALFLGPLRRFFPF